MENKGDSKPHEGTEDQRGKASPRRTRTKAAGWLRARTKAIRLYIVRL